MYMEDSIMKTFIFLNVKLKFLRVLLAFIMSTASFGAYDSAWCDTISSNSVEEFTGFFKEVGDVIEEEVNSDRRMKEKISDAVTGCLLRFCTIRELSQVEDIVEPFKKFIYVTCMAIKKHAVDSVELKEKRQLIIDSFESFEQKISDLSNMTSGSASVSSRASTELVHELGRQAEQTVGAFINQMANNKLVSGVRHKIKDASNQSSGLLESIKSHILNGLSREEISTLVSFMKSSVCEKIKKNLSSLWNSVVRVFSPRIRKQVEASVGQLQKNLISSV